MAVAMAVAGSPFQLPLHPIKLGRRAIEPPEVADQRQDDEQGHPAGPEVVRAVGRPHDHTDREDGQPPAALLDQPSLELVPALGQLGLDLLGCGRQRREIAQERLELLLGADLVDPRNPFVEFVLAQTSSGEMLAQQPGGVIPLLVGDA